MIYFSNTFPNITLSRSGNSNDFSEQMEFVDSLKEKPVPYDIDKLKNEGVSTIYYRMITPDTKEILNCKSSIYYIQKFEIYFGISEFDVVKSFTDLLLSDISSLNIGKKVYAQIKEIVQSCENTMQARIEYDKFVNMKESRRD